MAELTFRSPGVSTREIDLSGPTAISPRGIPAGVVGTALRGPAFVPVTFATFQDFKSTFGPTDGEKFGPLAVNEWMKNAGAGTYVRVLGVGNGKARTDSGTNAGNVTNAGFIVGNRMVQANGNVGNNPYVGETLDGAPATATLLVSDSAKIKTGGGAKLSAGTGTDLAGGLFVGTTGVGSLDGDTITLTCGSGLPSSFTDVNSVALASTTHVITLKNADDMSDAGFDGIGARECFISITTGAGGAQTAVADVATRIAAAIAGDATNIILDRAGGNATVAACVRYGTQWGLCDTNGGALTAGGDINSVFVASTSGAGVVVTFRGSQGDDTASYAENYGRWGGVVIAADTDAKLTTGGTAGNLNGGGSAGDLGVTTGNDTGASTIKLRAGGGDDGTETTLTANATSSGFAVSTTAALTGDNLQVAINALSDFSAVDDDAGNVTITDTKNGHSVDGNLSEITQADATGAFTVQGVLNGTNQNFTGGKDSAGLLGRTYFLGCFMSQSNGSNIFTDAGIQSNKEISPAHPIIRGVLMAPSGVVLALSSTYVANNTPQTDLAARGGFGTGSHDAGISVGGDVDLNNSKQEFTMLINGLKPGGAYANVLTASFDPSVANYFAKGFNTDPARIEEAGHYLYTHYDIDPNYAIPTGSGGIIDPSAVFSVSGVEPLAFLLTGSAPRNTGVAASTTAVGVPNFENFEDRFTTSFSPFVISQKFGGKNVNLFKLHALDDGLQPTKDLKVTVENIAASTNVNNKYGKFDLLIRSTSDNDQEPVVLESFRGLSIDPGSDRFVGRVIGDTYTFYDFDKKAGGQKLVVEGLYPNNSAYVRVEVTDDVRNGRVDEGSLPVGFRGVYHLVTSGSAAGYSSILTGSYKGSGMAATAPPVDISSDELARSVQPPIPFRLTLHKGTGLKKTVETALTWGVQYELQTSVDEPNSNTQVGLSSSPRTPSVLGFTKYFPNFATSKQKALVGDNAGTADKGGTILDADRFNNNLFSLERVEVITSSNDKPDSDQWAVAAYRRDGVAKTTMTDVDQNATQRGSRFLDPDKDFSHVGSQKYFKFTFPIQGGFNGVNIFDADKANFRDAAVRREMDDASNQGGTKGPTVAALRKAVDVMEEKSDVDIQLLTIPGIRHEAVTDYAVESTERRFDALYILDIEEKDTNNAYITGSTDKVVNVTNTINRFATRNMDSSFAAACFPDVTIQDPATATNVVCPPSVAVLGAFSLNDQVAHPWFAPAGFTRGALKSVIEAMVKLNRTNLDELYTVDVNPLTAFPHTPGVVVFGQKTLLAAQSSLDRVNVRRLLIDIRRKVKRIANSLLFEPNRESTLAKFSAAVTPVLTTIQQQQGLDRFKVQIDTSTTTQADVENNTIRGKIFLQPTRAVEFISLDFVVTNAGSDV